METQSQEVRIQHPTHSLLWGRALDIFSLSLLLFICVHAFMSSANAHLCRVLRKDSLDYPSKSPYSGRNHWDGKVSDATGKSMGPLWIAGERKSPDKGYSPWSKPVDMTWLQGRRWGTMGRAEGQNDGDMGKPCLPEVPTFGPQNVTLCSYRTMADIIRWGHTGVGVQPNMTSDLVKKERLDTKTAMHRKKSLWG